ncbi:MAG: pyridoxine 5'-phosphate synthase [Saprospiraceae bacterium]|nr:pyridoxine 5'-phosphate synthase [Saprospiraceae bacterium]
MSTKLSVNLNKVALIRNSRGANLPDVIQVAKDCEHFGADGITMHPRPDERHARYSDIPALKEIVKTELNVEGYPNARFLNMICEVVPHQCTLVPDPPGALTSDNGWDTISNQSMLKEICDRLRDNGIRSSLFVNPDNSMIDGAKEVGADRIELYTGPYAHNYFHDREKAICNYREAAIHARNIGIEVNAGHDLNLDNLNFFISQIPWTAEVSIGHAIICDALYYGLQNVIQMYQYQINK